MAYPRRRAEDVEEVIKTRWFTVYKKGIVFLVIALFIFGIFSVIIFNVGYDQQQGCYLKPSSLDVDVNLKKKE
jgi:hypothetical protein